jgi:hypothetical protein
MNKYTKKVNDQNVISLEDVKIEGEYITGEVIDRLAKFESFYEEIEKNQITISEQLEVLRSEGKDKTVEYKELFTKKLVNNNVMAFLRYHGLAPKK